MSKKASVKLTPEQKAQKKKDDFVRLAKQRVSNAVKRINMIGFLSGAVYTSTPEQVAKIVKCLQLAVDGVAAKLTKQQVGQAELDL